MTAKRTPAEGQVINFWGGTPGTEQPAGIWQNVMFEQVKSKNISEEEYSKTQSILAQSVADSFMECWKVKYTYWTQRPDMADPTINTFMKDPNFPSYVSGHSTVSRTASDVLGAIFPDKAETFLNDAKAARDSRLYAGIHFDIDNQEGFSLGHQVGKFIINKLSLDKSNDLHILASGILNPRVTKESDDNKKGILKDLKSSLYFAHNPTNSTTIALVSSDDSSVVKGINGWNLEVKGSDVFWRPGACSSMPSTTFNSRYLGFLNTKDGGIYDPLSPTELIIYDSATKLYSYIASDPLQANLSAISALDDGVGVSYFYFPSKSFTKIDPNYREYNFNSTYIVKREVQIPPYSYIDYMIELPPEFQNTKYIRVDNNFKQIYLTGLEQYSVLENNKFGKTTSIPSNTSFSDLNNPYTSKMVESTNSVDILNMKDNSLYLRVDDDFKINHIKYLDSDKLSNFFTTTSNSDLTSSGDGTGNILQVDKLTKKYNKLLNNSLIKNNREYGGADQILKYLIYTIGLISY